MLDYFILGNKSLNGTNLYGPVLNIITTNLTSVSESFNLNISYKQLQMLTLQTLKFENFGKNKQPGKALVC